MLSSAGVATSLQFWFEFASTYSYPAISRVETVARAAGVTVAMDVMEFPPCRIFFVKDPDGNQLGLHQRKAKPNE